MKIEDLYHGDIISKKDYKILYDETANIHLRIFQQHRLDKISFNGNKTQFFQAIKGDFNSYVIQMLIDKTKDIDIFNGEYVLCLFKGLPFYEDSRLFFVKSKSFINSKKLL